MANEVLKLIERDITDVVIDSTVTTIGYGAFSNCQSLTSLTIGENVSVISDVAFFRCTSLENVTIPISVTSIGSSAFSSCSALANITIPDNVTSIGNYAFSGCSSLTSVTVEATTPPTLGSAAFDDTNNCPILVPAESVDAYKTAWPAYASRIQANTFAMRFTPTGGGTSIEVELENLATAGTIESTDVPTEIKNGAGTLEIGEGVTSIGTSAFIDGTSLTSVTLPSTLTSIGWGAFAGCTGLTSVTIPSSVTNIGTGAFNNCSSLASVTVNATTPPTSGISAFYDDENDYPIYVPAESVDAYKAATKWSTYADRIHIYGVADYIEVSYVCEVDENGKNTGMIIKTYQDLNPSSPTYGQSYTVTEEAALNRCLPISISKITDISQITDGKYLIVKEIGYSDGVLAGKALYASKIKNTTRGGGLNSSSEKNWFAVIIENNNIKETWYVDDAISDGFVEYNSTDGTLEWTDETTGTTYYLSNQSNSSNKFTWSNLTTKPANRISPQQTSGGAFVFAQTRALGSNTDDYNYNSFIKWYDVSSSYMDGMALYKLEE